jgi:hypothetical protein
VPNRLGYSRNEPNYDSNSFIMKGLEKIKSKQHSEVEFMIEP